MSCCLSCQQVKAENLRLGGEFKRLPIVESYFLVVQSSFSAERLARINIRKEELATRIDLNTTFHPHTNGQSECTIQVLKDTFKHVFWSLKWYVPEESNVIPYDAVKVDDHLNFVEETISILAKDVRQLRLRAIPVVKVYWRHCPIEKATWEIEHDM
ncbi:hypothetical protein MTR67_052415 [Solanum verrucosum]|uniref:Uncharacterized protein n=1 Tax=Solanum verrucosum TaxID=315347 RepID=A0AAF1A388_SOLVR|nr:hypothetical protein MTR67_052415 [Solanum verrucosum]